GAPGRPFAATDSVDPEDLWRWMDGLRATGIEALAIPHNSNWSNGIMFQRTAFDGRPHDREYAPCGRAMNQSSRSVRSRVLRRRTLCCRPMTSGLTSSCSATSRKCTRRCKARPMPRSPSPAAMRAMRCSPAWRWSVSWASTPTNSA
ncbi:MAG: DUF3604 domain-containing protein, partial [Gammaproteobacteria bacterium]|nr:DUF3604 domain-containing protein [Gammaproteobacteria bacterium]